MQGPHSARKFVTDYLKADLPRRVDDYRNARRAEGEWYLDDSTLPTPDNFLIYEPIALDVWPTIITLAMSTTNMSRIDYAPGMDPLYRVSYSMRTYVWVRAEGSEEATLMRDRLTTVVRSSLLDRPCLMANDPSKYLEVMIDEGTMREEFSDLTLLKGERVMAGAYISYDMYINERITREPLGTVDEFQIDVQQFSLEAEEIDLSET